MLITFYHGKISNNFCFCLTISTVRIFYTENQKKPWCCMLIKIGRELEPFALPMWNWTPVFSLSICADTSLEVFSWWPTTSGSTPATPALSHLMKINGLQHFNLWAPALLSAYLNLFQLGSSSQANLLTSEKENRPAALTQKQVEVIHGCLWVQLLNILVCLSSPPLP